MADSATPTTTSQDSLSNRILTAITSNPTVAKIAGKVGKGIDVLGSAGLLGFGTPGVLGTTTQIKYPELGISEQLESSGSAGLTPQQQAEKVTTRSAEKGITPVYTPQNIQYAPASAQPTGQPDMGSLIEMYKKQGWTDEAAIKSDIAAGNWKSKVPSTGGDGGGTPPPKVDTNQAITNDPNSKWLDQNDIQDLIREYGDDVSGRTDALANAIEQRATVAAEREYQTILGILGGQKEEAGTLATEQREAAKKQGELTTEELKAKQESETQTIEQQKTKFKEETKESVEMLAQNWRDLSRELQRLARARGISDSAFAANKETDLMLNFNSGLIKIAQESSEGIKNLSDAVIETTKFYTRQKNQLDFQLAEQTKAIDAWERQQIANIQGQEKMAYNKKLAAIENAMSQADQLRINTANSITEKKLSWGLFLQQLEYNYRTAVAVAAQGKVGSALDNISKTADLVKLTGQILDNGGEIVPQKNDQGELTGGYIHGIIPGTNEEVWLPITPGGTVNLALQQAGSLYGKIGQDTELKRAEGVPSYNQILETLTPGLTNTQTQTTETTPANNSIFNKILSAFNYNPAGQ